MSIVLPTAPANFYTPSLQTLKDDLDAVNGSTVGQYTLLSGLPDNPNTAWNQVGAGAPEDRLNRGSLVAGQTNVGVIVGPIPSLSETAEETGYKLQFQSQEVIVDIATTSLLIYGFALIVGRDTHAEGNNLDVRYFNSMPGSVIDGQIITIPEWELIINYAEPKVL